MYEFKQSLITRELYSIKSPYAMNPMYIVVHNTSNDASAEKEIAYMKSNTLQVSYHVAVDDIQVIQAIPFNRNAWHAGDGQGVGNRSGIGIEICYSKTGGKKFTIAEDNAAQYIASLLQTFGWGIDRVTTHQLCSGKYCPHRTLDLGWNRFLKKIERYLADLNKPKTILPSIEDCTQELIWRGIISNQELWNNKAEQDEDTKWILVKYYSYIMVNGGSVKSPISIPTIEIAIEILHKQEILTDVEKWKVKSTEDEDIKFLLLKLSDYIN